MPHPSSPTWTPFPQATNRLWVPSEADVPEAWRSRIEEEEHRKLELYTILWCVGFVAVVLTPALISAMGSCLRGGCFKATIPKKDGGRCIDEELVEREDRERETKEGKKKYRWVT